jgi:hypothetical protein
MDSWLIEARDAIAATSGIPASDLDLADEEVTILLDLARIAAHESGDRTNAPLLCYLIGKAGRTASLDELARAITGTATSTEPSRGE